MLKILLTSLLLLLATNPTNPGVAATNPTSPESPVEAKNIIPSNPTKIVTKCSGVTYQVGSTYQVNDKNLKISPPKSGKQAYEIEEPVEGYICDSFCGFAPCCEIRR